jgi:hypothetical protein
MLATRMGALAWLDCVNREKYDLAALLKRRVLKIAGSVRLARWSGVNIEQL